MRFLFISPLLNLLPVAQNQQTPPAGNDVAGSAIFKKFLKTAEGYVRQPTRMKTLLTDAYKKASDKNDVGTLAHEAWETLQTMFRLIKSSMSGEYTGVPSTTVLAAVAVLVYFLSPIDLIPDFIPVLGMLDDVALVAWFSTTLKGEMDKFNEWEATRPVLATEAPTTDRPAAEAALRRTDAPQPAAESAKNAGTTNLPAANADATSSASSHTDAAPSTTDTSRSHKTGTVDTGGNVR